MAKDQGKGFETVLSMSNGYFQHHECTPQEIQSFISKMEDMKFEFDKDRMFKEISRRHTVRILSPHSVLEDSGDHEDWINLTTKDGLRRDIDWHYWTNYKEFLLQKGFSASVVDELDDSSTTILSRMEDPSRIGEWDRRGMVMGSVQSGKTASYTGLIAKAIDAGYKIVVILTGVHNSLRSQTQVRIIDEILGYDNDKAMRMEHVDRKVGVGKYPDHFKNGYVQSLTTSNEKGDFKKGVATTVGYSESDPYILVVKKHVSILKNLVDWLANIVGEKDEDGRDRVAGIPLLVIDDECDQASVNTKKVVMDPDTGLVNDDCDPTKTNMRIRQLLTLFDQSAYVGYTATPYANIFIHEGRKHPLYGDDIFPRNFIVNLTQPDNYVGAKKIFGISQEANTLIDDQEGVGPLPILGKPVDDHEDFIPARHDKDHIIHSLPNSLKTSVRRFVLSCAAKRERRVRNPHNSMLVHVTRFTNVQNQVHRLIEKEIRTLFARINSPGDDLTDLRKLWEDEFRAISKEMDTEDMECPDHTWEEILEHLPIMVKRIKVLAINGSSKDALHYREAQDSAARKRARGEEVPWEDQGSHVIAIGGDKLSRGLTLEGLTTTYYLRPSNMYDTLMQMGRWFGYRPGYLDLCRIQTTADIISYFQQISTAEVDLRDQFDQMALLGMEPKEFGLYVLEDPGMMMITNSGKRRDAPVVDVSFSGRISETINFDLDSCDHNIKVLENLIRACEHSGNEVYSGNNHQWKGVSRDVICDFLYTYSGFGGATVVRPKVIADFIQMQDPEDLREWTVAIMSKVDSSRQFSVFGKKMGCWTRKAKGQRSMGKLAIGRLVSPKDEWIDFDDEEKESCRESFARLTQSDPSEKVHLPPGTHIRDCRDRSKGLLLIYPLCSTKDPSEDNRYGHIEGENVYGFAISFPADRAGGAFRKKRVRVNKVFEKTYFGED